MIKKQKGVMGLCNASALLNHLQLEIPYGFKLHDPVVKENNGNFDFFGHFNYSPFLYNFSFNILSAFITVEKLL